MGIELKYEKGRCEINHDGNSYTFKDLEAHISNNHAREPVYFVAKSMEEYREMQRIASDIEAIFSGREKRLLIRTR